MGDGGSQFTQRRHARYMCEFRLRPAQRLLGIICADPRSNIGASTAIADEISLCVKQRLTARPDIYRRSTLAYGAIYEIAKWQMGVVHRPMHSPFFGFRFDISCNIQRATPVRREGTMPTALRWSDTRVTRWSGPVSQNKSEAVSA